MPGLQGPGSQGGGGTVGGGALPSENDGFKLVLGKKAQQALKKAAKEAERVGNTASPTPALSFAKAVSPNAGTGSQVAATGGSPPAAKQGQQGKQQQSKRGHKQAVPPGHPEYGVQNSSYFGGRGGFRTGPKTLVPLDDGMDFEFAVKMSL